MHQHKNVLNRNFIDYIIKKYVPDILKKDNEKKHMNMKLFVEALTHKSYSNNETIKNYERLEFLGDAIFHMFITEYLYNRYDEENEGFLTRLRIKIERGDSMAELSKILGLDNCILYNKIQLNDHILEDVFEAFIGAFYLNFGIKFTKQFIIRVVEMHKNLSEIISHDDNYKDLLLRYFHQKKWGHPIYVEKNNKTKQSGSKTSKHKMFRIVVNNPFNKVIGVGISKSKKIAEQLASKDALINMNVIIDGEIDANWIDKIEKVEKEEKEKKTGKKTMSVFNTSNKLIQNKDIKKILLNYNTTSDKKYNMKIFYEAMTHRTYLKRKKLTEQDKKESINAVKLQQKSNERLQFLGDAIIHFIIAEYLFYKYPESDEGFLTRLRCKLENRESLYYLAKQTDISSYILVSQNIEVLHGRNNVNIIGGGFEAFIGAIYLNLGIITSKNFLLEIIRTELNISKIAENETNYKDLILQIYNSNRWGIPCYKVIKEEGPDHKKIFTIGLYLENDLMGVGKANTKKKAEQIASKNMYMRMDMTK